MNAAFRRLPTPLRPAATAYRVELVRWSRAPGTWGAFTAAAIITTALAALVASFVTDSGEPALRVAFALLKVTMLAAGICGAIAATGDARARDRAPSAPTAGLLLAKAAAFATVVFALALAVYTAATLLVFAIIAARGLPLELGGFWPTWLAVPAAALATALIGVIGLAVGALASSRAAGVIAAAGLLFALPLATTIAYLVLGRQQWIYDVTAVLPLAVAKNVVFADEPGTAQLPSLLALLILTVWAVAALAGVWLHRRSMPRQRVAW